MFKNSMNYCRIICHQQKTKVSLGALCHLPSKANIPVPFFNCSYQIKHTATQLNKDNELENYSSIVPRSSKPNDFKQKLTGNEVFSRLVKERYSPDKRLWQKFSKEAAGRWATEILCLIALQWPEREKYALSLANSLMDFMFSDEKHLKFERSFLVWSAYACVLSNHIGSDSGISAKHITSLLYKKGVAKSVHPEEVDTLYFPLRSQLYCNLVVNELKSVLDIGEKAEMLYNVEEKQRHIEDIICRLIEENHIDMAFQCLRKMTVVGSRVFDAYHVFIPSDKIITSVLKADSGVIMTPFLKFLRQTSSILTEESAKSVKKWFKLYHSQQCHGKQTSLYVSSGTCKQCGQKLSRKNLWSEKEFNKIKEAFEKMLSSQILTSEDQREYKRFTEFLQQMTPVDVVLDSLNISFSISVKSQLDSENKILPIWNVVNDLVKGKNLRVLIIAKKHQIQYAPLIWDEIKQIAQCFFIEDISETFRELDDLLILYGAVFHGVNTMFVTDDRMNNHIKTLESELNFMFSRWTSHRRIGTFSYTEPYVMLRWPQLQYMWTQYTEDSIHIPYLKGHYESQNGYVDFNNIYGSNVLCIQKKVSKRK